jgi:hypothetical protein
LGQYLIESVLVDFIYNVVLSTLSIITGIQALGRNVLSQAVCFVYDTDMDRGSAVQSRKMESSLINHWEEFPGGQARPPGERMYVSLNTRFVLMFNQTTFEKIGSPERVVMLYDRRNSMIGVRAASPDARNTFPVAVSARTHRSISIGSFCRHYAIRIDRPVAFQDPEVLEDGTLRLDLRTTTYVGRK